MEVENAKCFYRQKQNSEFKQNKKLGKINKQLKQHIFCSKYQVKAWKNVLSHHPFFEGKKTNKQTKESAGCKLLMLSSHISVKANMWPVSHCDTNFNTRAVNLGQMCIFITN